jgi:hypothetical protein
MHHHHRLLPAVVAALLLCSVACAPVTLPKPRQFAIASEQLALATERLQTLEIQLYEAGQFAATDHAVWQQSFLALGQAIQALNQGLRSNNPPHALTQIRKALDILQFLTLQTSKLKPTEKLLLAAAIESVRSIVIAMSTDIGEAS